MSSPRLATALLALSSVAIIAADDTGAFPQTLKDKGLSGATVLRNAKPFTPARPVPAVRYLSENDLSAARGPIGIGNIDPIGIPYREISFTLKERDGVNRQRSLVRLGFPFPKGQLYSLRHISVIDPSKTPLPLQAHALALWPDGSVKAALLQFERHLQAGEEQSLTLRFGYEVSATALQNASDKEPISITQSASGWTITTENLTLRLTPGAFSPLGEISINGNWFSERLIDHGLELRDAAGTVYSSKSAPVDSISVERHGPLDAQIRVEGHLADAAGYRKHLRYITRLQIHAHQPRVEVGITFINDRLDNEFTDFRSVTQAFSLPGLIWWSARWQQGDTPQKTWRPQLLRQIDDPSQNPAALTKRLSGAVNIRSVGRATSLAYHDLWQRWPKGISLRPGKLKLEHLPPLPGNFGADLPGHLSYSFVEGCYRMKWGMAFTERYTLDFSGEQIGEAPSVRLPLGYLAETGVFGRFPLRQTPLLGAWNRYMERSLEAYLHHRRQTRAFGFLNWGDWWGERGRNWGNNEYDLPHGFFRQYLLTGDERYFDIALRGVRHQVDSDLVHAYPDPYYRGANAQHGIGHTGITSHDIPARWSFPYGHTIDAGNGHTWADGMADCWLLTGDATVMEALIGLGEHIRFAFAPATRGLGTHHRGLGWAAIAAAATFRATGDEAYLEGMKLLMETPIKVWDAKTGIWPYELAPGHANGQSGVQGSNLYNLGILLQALVRYHELTADPRVPEILRGASGWLVHAFQQERGWPYSATVDGTPLRNNPSINLNPLLYPPLAYAGTQIGDPASTPALQTVRTALKALEVTFIETELDPLPKELSIKAYGTLEALGLLESSAHPSHENHP